MKAHCVRAKTKVSAEISLFILMKKKAVDKGFQNTRTRQKDCEILYWRLLSVKALCDILRQPNGLF